MATASATAALVQSLTNLLVTVEQLPMLRPPTTTPRSAVSLSGEEAVPLEPVVEYEKPDAALKEATRLALFRVLEGIEE